MKRQALSVDSSGNCVLGSPVARALQGKERVVVRPMPSVRAPRKVPPARPPRQAEDPALFVMRFGAWALVLFVLVLLVLHM